MKDKPGIFQVGYVREDSAGKLHVHGWGVGPCARQCRCHVITFPRPRVELLDDPDNGLLGLVSRDQSCDCCEPWTVDELASVLDSFRQINQMRTT